MKNGPNGIKRARRYRAQIAPVMHAIINATANPDVPNHMPPTPINLISPMPIGAGASELRRRKK